MKWLTAFIITIFIVTTVNAGPLMYVPAGEANDLVIIDLDSDKITGRIDELENAHGLAASPNAEYLVAGSMQPLVDGTVSSISKPDAVTDDEHAAHHAGGDVAAMKSSSYLSIVHPKHGHVMRRIPVPTLTHHTAVSPDGKYAIAVHSGAGGISIVDLRENRVKKTIQTGMWPNYAVFNSDGKYLYISNAGPGTVSEIDTHGWSVVREFSVGKKPEHMVLSADGLALFVANVDEGTASAVELKTGVVTSSFAVGAKPHGIDVSDDGRWLFVSSKNDQTLSRIDLADKSMTAIDLKPAPYHVAYAAGVNKLYVSSRKAPNIWVLDPITMKVISEIDIGQGAAHQMVVLPR